ncbi:hypothetical protein E4T42_01573 [Aureobasidium subglaciale]|nr:hypothetical protein E4T38_05224 [Aureobasidium subglaciale]KAI5220345.1 hypothetical protein E4T40_05988 [Aureobasidium subglaciale]KAI5222884.1 hypothetical protein E4T41_06414 [Aureobasidium subglaciale]KAI5256335.1 hypothetical protein E4T42_01573 [Aureobasidium subglaciale]KAI5260153.1 hypothetical protein E4T46_06296 [Aureobasidium subglaciale]
MSTLETIALPHLPQYPLCVGLFKDVKNATFLRQQLLAGNADFEYAFLDASVIAESFRRFGISDTTQHVLAIKVLSGSNIAAESVSKHLQENIDGEQVEVSDAILADLADQARLRKIYKLNVQAKKGAANGTTSPVSEIKELETSILGVMALKGGARTRPSVECHDLPHHDAQTMLM